MENQKKLLPSPIFGIINQNQTKSSSIPVSNSVVKQVKCLASHKLYPSGGEGDTKTEKKNNSFHNRKNRNRVFKPEFNSNHKFDSKSGQWCETCDRKFHTAEQFNKHKQYEHKKCGINGCKFEAHPLVISKHIREQHQSGLYDKIRKLNTPEEIAKWRAERIKRYPTKTNIELRQKAQEEKMKRGEKLTDRRSAFGKRQQNRNRKPINKEKQPTVCEQQKSKNEEKKIHDRFGRKQKLSNMKKPKTGNKMRKVEKIENTQLKQKPKKDIQEKEEHFSDDGENSQEIPRFKGTKNINVSVNCRESDERDRVQNQNALTNLLNIYGSGSDDESESGEHEIINNSISFVGNEDVKFNLTEEIISTELKDLSAHSVDECMKPISAEEILCKANTNDSNFVQKCSDSEDDAPEEIPIVKTNTNNAENEFSVKESLKKKETSIAPKFTTKKNQKLIKKQLKNGLNYSKLKYHKPRTLLEKLLEPDIRHERNILLQCVRFVVENKFFNIGCSRDVNISEN